MKPCSQSCNVYSILMGHIWKSTELAWLVPCEYPQQGHKEAQTYNSIQWQLCTTGPKDLAQVLPGRAHGCYLSTLASLTPCHVETIRQHCGHPLSHAVFNFLSVPAYAKKDNPPRMEAVLCSSSQAPLLWAAPEKQKFGFPNYRQLQAGGVTFQFCFQRKIIN